MSSFNMSESDYLSLILGPRYLPLDVTIPLTLVYATIFISGIFGNAATCLVIIKDSTMQNATNFYLFSLAVSDLILLLLGIPNELSVFWQQYPWAFGLGLCKFRAYVSEMSSYVSVLTILIFSIERYLAVCHPLNFISISGTRRSIYFIIASWILASICALPFAMYTTISYVEYPPGTGNYSVESAICAMLLIHMPSYPLYELSSMVFFFIPMFVIIILYIQMGIKIRASYKLRKEMNAKLPHESSSARTKKGITKMLSAVVCNFLICWAPFHIQRLMYVYGQDNDYYPDMNEWLYIFSGCFYYLSTVVNPLLYNFMSSRYRNAYKQMFHFKQKIKSI